MTATRFILTVSAVVSVALSPSPAPATVRASGSGQATPAVVTLRAARLLDGRGQTLTNVVLEVRGNRIVRIDQRTGPVTHDLGNATLMPGLMDVHTHVDWHFGPDGQYPARNETAEQRKRRSRRTSSRRCSMASRRFRTSATRATRHCATRSRPARSSDRASSRRSDRFRPVAAGAPRRPTSSASGFASSRAKARTSSRSSPPKASGPAARRQ